MQNISLGAKTSLRYTLSFKSAPWIIHPLNAYCDPTGSRIQKFIKNQKLIENYWKHTRLIEIRFKIINFIYFIKKMTSLGDKSILRRK